MKKVLITVVIPVYKCCGALREIYDRLNKTLSLITDKFEIIFVNDASPDNSWEIIKELANLDNRVKGIKLSKNFGQHYAITAGLDFVQGEWVVVMDCDLQDKPEEIIKLYNKAKEGYDIVFGRRINRKDNFFKKMSSKLFYIIFNYFTDNNLDCSSANFSIVNIKVIDVMKKFKEQNRFYYIFLNYVGFNKTYIEIEHSERKEGKSSYSLKKLSKLALDIIISYSNKPLRISIIFGFIMSFLSFLYGLFIVLKYFLYKITIPGWTSLIVSLFFIGGLILSNLGILGIYIGKIFNEVKGRPLYIIEEIIL